MPQSLLSVQPVIKTNSKERLESCNHPDAKKFLNVMPFEILELLESLHVLRTLS